MRWGSDMTHAHTHSHGLFAIPVCYFSVCYSRSIIAPCTFPGPQPRFPLQLQPECRWVDG